MELERNKILVSYIRKVILTAIIALTISVFLNSTNGDSSSDVFFGFLIFFAGIICFGIQEESKYKKIFRKNFFSKITSDEYFQNILFETEKSEITSSIASDSELFEMSSFTSENNLSYEYKDTLINISKIKSERTGKNSRTYADGIFAMVDLKEKINPDFFVTDNSKSFSLFMTKIGNKLFPNKIKIELKKYEDSDLSERLTIYALSEIDKNKYLTTGVKDALGHNQDLIEFSLRENKLYVMFNNVEFDLCNDRPFFLKFDLEKENPEQKIHKLKIYLSKTLHKIIDDVK